MKRKVALDYLGCKVNQAEIEELGRRLQEAGFSLESAHEDPDVYILNSCTVTHVADRKARLLIHQMARRNPNTQIIVTGCFSTVDPAAVQAIEGVDLVLSNADKERLVEIVEAMVRPSSPTPLPALGEGRGDAPSARPSPPTSLPALGEGRGGAPSALIPSMGESDTAPSPNRGEGWGEGRSPLARTRAMLKVQDGCDHFCTYCIVPEARGHCRSVPLPEVVGEVQRRVAMGYQEVVLTGVALGSYGRDGGENDALTELVSSILRETEIPRLRLSSLEPEYLDSSMLDLWSDARFCRHLHLPLQSGCDATLKRMGRRYRAAGYADLVARARAIAPDVAVTTDVIVGFPGETEAEFAQSIAFAQAMAFAKIHVFRFSARRGTPATRLPGRISEPEKKERAAAMLALSADSGRAYRQRFIGATRQVLWEELTIIRGTDPGEMWWTGVTDNYIRVYASSRANLHNRLHRVRLVAEMADGLLGEI